jgi:hypothetical protein
LHYVADFYLLFVEVKLHAVLLRLVLGSLPDLHSFIVACRCNVFAVG